LFVVAAVVAPSVARHFDNHRLAAGLPLERRTRRSVPWTTRWPWRGICEIFSLCGPDLDRHVEYLTGDDDTIKRPLATTYPKWLASLRSHHVTAVVTGRDACFPLASYAPEVEWAATHPETFHLIETDQNCNVTTWSQRLLDVAKRVVGSPRLYDLGQQIAGLKWVNDRLRVEISALPRVGARVVLDVGGGTPAPRIRARFV